VHVLVEVRVRATRLVVQVDADEASDAVPVVAEASRPAATGVECHGSGLENRIEQASLDDGVVGLHDATLEPPGS
jgi:hypothetical protein